MRNLLKVSLLLVLIAAVSGCVSKKKYLAMETLKNQYVRQANTLQKENDVLKNDLESAEVDFESLDQNLHYSNAKKDESLQKLSSQLKEMEENFNMAQSELSRTRDLYKDQRFYNTQASNEITRLEFAIEQLKRDTISLNYSLKLAKQRHEETKNRLQERVVQLNEKHADISELNGIITEKEVEISSLAERISAQKVQIEDINTAFIELRKTMLRAKANNTVVDPGTDPNVAKISKALGHF